MKLEGKTVTVVGLGASGLAAARLLLARGATVVLNDRKSEAELGKIALEARALGARLDLGGHDAERLAQSDLIVLSPGVPPLPELAAAERRGVAIVSEIELASWFIEAQVVGITGTNGKSTVTTLLGEMSKESGVPTFVGGNLGTPLVEAVDSPAAKAGGRVVVELSSFQLERVDRFRAHVAVLLNVTDDHLDRYPSFAEYAAAKGRIFAGQRADDQAIVPDGDELCRSLAAAGRAAIHRFSGAGSVTIADQRLVDRESGLTIPVSEIGIQGAHNLDNACAAALAARLCGIEPQVIAKVLRSFKGLPHRMYRTASVAGVEFYDDSKATNVGAAVAAVQGLGRAGVRVVLIAGGKDKGGSYAPLVEAMKGHGRGLVLIGEAAPLLRGAFAESGLVLAHASDMADAVRRAAALARAGDAVLLAPACASFDMFRSYAHRGDVFQEAVKQYAQEVKS